IYFRNLILGCLSVGYQRKTPGKPGRWVMRTLVARDRYSIAPLGTADDYGDADGSTVLDFAEASELAMRGYRGNAASGEEDAEHVTVAQALDRYEADLQLRRGDTGNVARVRLYLPDALASKAVVALVRRDLLHLRDAMIKQGLAPASVNRSLTGL